MQIENLIFTLARLVKQIEATMLMPNNAKCEFSYSPNYETVAYLLCLAFSDNNSQLLDILPLQKKKYGTPCKEESGLTHGVAVRREDVDSVAHFHSQSLSANFSYSFH